MELHLFIFFGEIRFWCISIDYALNLKVRVLVWKCTLFMSVMVRAGSCPLVVLKHTTLIKSFKSAHFV